MNKLSEKIKKINIKGNIEFDIDLKDFSTFKTGGKADIFVSPRCDSDIIEIRKFAEKHSISLFILGGGANLLISDMGIRGITIYTGLMNKCSLSGSEIIAETGMIVNELSETAKKGSLTGLEFIYGMPGSLGGALWMNARCYGREISEIFKWSDIINEENEVERILFESKNWAYKRSPFQNRNIVILRSCFSLKQGNKDIIQKEMDKNYNDRKDKGHFNAPCAGSVFKNNRTFGKPTGVIIDQLGLRGLSIGKAAVSDFHANIIINRGGAKASDILDLIHLVQNKVKKETGFDLETEVIPVGDWR